VVAIDSAMKSAASLLLLLVLAAACFGASPVQYKIHIDPNDLSGFDVEMRFVPSAHTVRVAMAAHPEYDDRYWTYIESFSATSASRTLNVSKPDDAVWQIDGATREILIKYRVHLPPQSGARDAWKPFLTPTGGMVGDLHSLMYIVGEDRWPAQVALDMPAGWKAACGLEPTADSHTFIGPTELVLDAPVMIGKFDEWDFAVRGVPHKIVIWSPADAKPFDAKPLVDGLEKLAAEAIKTFGGTPYRRYVFLFQNGGEAALEHLTSVNIGHDFSRGFDELFPEVAHEYFHAWNLMDVRPVERVGLSWRFAAPTATLWWNEGATIFFSDYIVRRAGLPPDEPSRTKRLENGMARYLTTPGYSTLSAEQASRGDADPMVMGDNYASTHLQGELLTTMLDLMIRDATNGRRSAVDIMRRLAVQFNYRHGITNQDIESVAAGVCPSCPVHQFFVDHIYGAKQIDFNRYLSLMGIRGDIGRTPGVGSDGKPIADMRLQPLPNQTEFRIRITSPQNTWGRAGLHTGDRLISVGGKPANSWTELRNWLRTLKIGDTGRVEIIRDGVRKTVEVPISGYDIAKVHLWEIENATPRQVRLRTEWLAAN